MAISDPVREGTCAARMCEVRRVLSIIGSGGRGGGAPVGGARLLMNTGREQRFQTWKRCHRRSHVWQGCALRAVGASCAQPNSIPLRSKHHHRTMSSVRTAIAPSFAGGGGGGDGGGKRGRDGGDEGGDRRRPGKPKPVDKLSAADFGPEGRLRQLVLMLLQLANLGTLPSGSLLTRGGQPKTLSERSTAVGRWVDGHLRAPVGLVQAKYSELAEAFVHILRAVNSAGLYDQLLAMLVELLTNRAVERAEGEDDD